MASHRVIKVLIQEKVVITNLWTFFNKGGCYWIKEVIKIIESIRMLYK